MCIAKAVEIGATGTIAETRQGGQEQRLQWHGQQYCLAQKT